MTGGHLGDVHRRRPGQVDIRERETTLVRGALDAGRHLLLEGPAGAGKSVLLRRAGAGRRLVEVNATAVFSSGGLIGHLDPAAALGRTVRRQTASPSDRAPAAFSPGPLLEAMRRGAVLVLDEVNRLPPEAFAAIVPAMSEGKLTVPGVATVPAAAGFGVVATANPDDRVGVGLLPAAFLDRVTRLRIGHPDTGDTERIVAAHVPRADRRLVARAVAVVRSSREHPDIALGASVRGAIDLCAVASALPAVELRGDEAAAADERLAARLALSARIRLAAHVTRTPEAVIDELWDMVVLTEHRAATGGGVHRMPPSALTAAAGPAADAARGTSQGPPERAGGSDPAGATRGTARGGGAGSGGPGARRPSDTGDDDQPPEMVRRETESALASFVEEAAPPGEAVALGEDPGPEELRRLLEVASRVVTRRLLGSPVGRARGSRLAPVRYNFRSDDLDMDRTLDELVANPLPAWSDIWVRDRVPRRRGVVLLLDVSGSMRGEPLVHAATAAGAAALVLRETDDLAVVAFWHSPRVLLAPGAPADVRSVVSRVLALRPWGLTDIAGGLHRGLDLLERMPTAHRQAMVMTDGRANAGADPTAIAARFPRLDVLATDRSPETTRRCLALATAGHGRCLSYDGVDELPLRLSELLSG